MTSGLPGVYLRARPSPDFTAPYTGFTITRGASMSLRAGIKIKFALILSGILFLTTLSMGVVMVMRQRASLEEQMRSMASTVTGQFSSDIKVPFMQKDGLAMNLLIENVMKYPGITDAYIINDNMQVESHKNSGAPGLRYDRVMELVRKASGRPPWIISDESGAVTFASPVVFMDTTVGYTVVSFSEGFIQERVNLAIKSVALITALSIITVSLISILMASTLLRPILRLFKGTQEIALGNLDYRIPEKGRDEISDLVRSFNRMASELKKKELLKGAFSRYVSRDVAEEILREPHMMRLGGDRREVTVFFADIRDFTSISRSLAPEETVELLNRYFTLVTEMVFRFNGTVDKFIGDAVMSVFGAPVTIEDHLELGVKAAVAIKTAIEKMNVSGYTGFCVPVNVGIGLDTGEVIAGNMGSRTRMEYTAVGYTVNTASRLAGLAKGGDIFISEKVYALVKDHVVAEKMIGVGVKGLETPLTLYNIKDLDGRWKQDVQIVLDEVLSGMETDVAY